MNIAGAKKLYLVVTDGGDGNNWDHADWIEPTHIGKKGKLKLINSKWLNVTAGATVKFHLFTQYSTPTSSEDSIKISLYVRKHGKDYFK